MLFFYKSLIYLGLDVTVPWVLRNKPFRTKKSKGSVKGYYVI